MRLVFLTCSVLSLLSALGWAAEWTDLAYQDTSELQTRMEKGELNAVELVEFHVSRIATLD